MQPKYCPNCREELEVEVCEDEEGLPLYDCYCPKCDWSGGISPDVEFNGVIFETKDLPAGQYSATIEGAEMCPDGHLHLHLGNFTLLGHDN